MRANRKTQNRPAWTWPSSPQRRIDECVFRKPEITKKTITPCRRLERHAQLDMEQHHQDDRHSAQDIDRVALVASAGFTIGHQTGWFGGANLRYFGPRPLIEDNSARSPAIALVNARPRYRFDNGIRVQPDALNLLNTPASQIDYFYASRLPGEPATGVADRHVHTVEPRALRLTVAGQF